MGQQAALLGWQLSLPAFEGLHHCRSPPAEAIPIIAHRTSLSIIPVVHM